MARILAVGAFLKNAACLLDTSATRTVQWSAQHGDLSDPQACVALEASVEQLLSRPSPRRDHLISLAPGMGQADGATLAAATPIDAVAHDLHPDFFSTHLAMRLAHKYQIPAIAVQHHHAHIATVLAEHSVQRPVIGIALDGVGLGTDGMAWGGEVLVVDAARYERLGHLSPLALPGGDAAAREPWRMAASLLHHVGAANSIVPRLAPAVGERAARTIQTMLQRGLNCPPTTAAGRWFDAVAGLLGLSVRQEFEAQAAIALEQAAARHLQSQGAAPVNTALWHITPDGRIDLRPWLHERLLPVDTNNPAAVDEAALSFHLTLAAALCQHAVALARAHQITVVALGGGCFFNRILKDAIVSQLEAAGLNVLQTRSLSCGDAGLALGQATVAEHLLLMGRGTIQQQNRTIAPVVYALEAI